MEEAPCGRADCVGNLGSSEACPAIGSVAKGVFEGDEKAMVCSHLLQVMIAQPKHRVFFLFLGLLLLAAGCTPPELRCLVSPISGKVTIHGAPVSGARVTQSYFSEWYNREVSRQTVSGRDGNFEFPGVWKTTPISLLHEPVIRQRINIEADGSSYKALEITKRDYEKFSEQDNISGANYGRLSREKGRLVVECELSRLRPARTTPLPEAGRLDSLPRETTDRHP